MQESNLAASDVEYVADMLKAIVRTKDCLEAVSPEALEDLESSLTVAEAALRRVAAEMQSIEKTV